MEEGSPGAQPHLYLGFCFCSSSVFHGNIFTSPAVKILQEVQRAQTALNNQPVVNFNIKGT